MIANEEIIRMALESKATAAAILNTSAIHFYEEVRKACEKNVCRKFDTNWMGPPAVGEIHALSQRVRAYRHGLLFQTVHQLTSSFDIKGMFEAARVQEMICRDLLERMQKAYPSENFLALNAGCCSFCEKCAYTDKQPCRHPDRALSSLEAYGMIVVELQKTAGLPYNNGKNTVTYVGMILFDKS
jgi:predicted metal-binding protein